MTTTNRKSANRHPLVVLLIAGVVLAGAFGAYAYWTSGGTGTGTADTGASANISVNQDELTFALEPGVAPQTLSGDFTNSTDGPVYVTSVTASIASVTPLEGQTCTAANYNLTDAVALVGAEAGVGTGVGASWTGPEIEFNNTAANQDGCQGATVNLAYVIA